jgi:hypothetical protein
MENKNFQILDIATFQLLSVKFISETIKDRGNLPTYYRKSQHNPFNNNKTHQNKNRKIKLLYTFSFYFPSNFNADFCKEFILMGY